MVTDGRGGGSGGTGRPASQDTRRDHLPAVGGTSPGPGEGPELG